MKSVMCLALLVLLGCNAKEQPTVVRVVDGQGKDVMTVNVDAASKAMAIRHRLNEELFAVPGINDEYAKFHALFSAATNEIAKPWVIERDDVTLRDVGDRMLADDKAAGSPYGWHKADGTLHLDTKRFPALFSQ